MFTSHSLKRFAARLQRSLPNRCLLCQQSCLSGQGLCELCLQDGDVGALCLGCSAPLTASNVHTCAACLTRSTHSNKPALICAYPYHHPIGRLVGAIKFQKKLSLIEPLCHTLATRLQTLWQQHALAKPYALIAVPMHSAKLQQRGFNHAAMIAHHLGQQLDLPVLDRLVSKQHPTPEQHGLDGKQRRRNLADCFAVKQEPWPLSSLPRTLAQQNIALVDDVITTGSTFASLTHTLQQHNVHVSQYWALASALYR